MGHLAVITRLALGGYEDNSVVERWAFDHENLGVNPAHDGFLI